MIIDTHTHIYLNKKSTPIDIISHLGDDNIDKIISIGIDIETSKTSIEFAKKYPQKIYASVGIHPTDVGKYEESFEETFDVLEKLIRENIPQVKAIGECGFDFYHINKEDFERQKALQEKFFLSQIDLAKKYNLPVIIHTRDAPEDTLRVLKESKYEKIIFHCFAQDFDFAQKALEFAPKSMISFSGIVTYKSALEVQKVAANIDLERILIETDCPYLAPQRVRGEENIPNYTKYNLEKIISLRLENGKNETPKQIEDQIYKNSLKIFNI